VANAAAKMLTGLTTLPFGYNGEKVAYERSHFWDWQARAYSANKAIRDAMSARIQAAYGKTRFDAYARGRQYFSTAADVSKPAGRKEFFAKLAGYLDQAGRQPDRLPLPYLGQLTKIGDAAKLKVEELNVLVSVFPHRTPATYAKRWHYEKLAELVGRGLIARKRADELFAVVPFLWKVGRDTGEILYRRTMADLCKAMLAEGFNDLAHVCATQGLERLKGALLSDTRTTLQSVRSQALAEVGGVIPVRRSDRRLSLIHI